LVLLNDAGGNLTALKESLSEVGVEMKPMHAKLLLNALNDLN
jgi:ribosomal protein L12E/L44/L45/RPP1/RPP2